MQAHTQTLTELAALPGLLERLQQELQAAMEAHTAQQHRLSAPNTAHPKLSVVGANSEQRITISPAYISEIRKAFLRGEQTA